jgi:hypothetical protein
MNCKPGDIAICIKDGPYKGHMFEIIELAPAHSFLLPNGYPHDPAQNHPSWVLKSVSGGVIAHFESGSTRRVTYGVGADSCLRPLRGIPDDIDVTNEVSA